MRARDVWWSALAIVLGGAAAAGCGLALDHDPPDQPPGPGPGVDGGRGTADGGTARDGAIADARARDGASDADPGACHEDIDCSDGLFCNGEEKCIASVCVVGAAPCDAPATCSTVTCVEAERSCPITDGCPPPTFCDPASDTCVECSTTSDCSDDGDPCTGPPTCVEGRCVDGDPPTCVETDGVECTAPHCEPFVGCTEIPDDVRCDLDGLSCTHDVCAPAALSADERGCLPSVRMDTACDDGAECTLDACVPLDATHDPVTGCIALPSDGRCSGPTLACGTRFCIGAQVVTATDPSGCAPVLDSSRCRIEQHCVTIADGALACDTISSTTGSRCIEESDCDDGSPCNGREGCETGVCIRRTSGCGDAPLCEQYYCDTTGAAPTCALRRNPGCDR